VFYVDSWLFVLAFFHCRVGPMTSKAQPLPISNAAYPPAVLALRADQDRREYCCARLFRPVRDSIVAKARCPGCFQWRMAVAREVFFATNIPGGCSRSGCGLTRRMPHDCKQCHVQARATTGGGPVIFAYSERNSVSVTAMIASAAPATGRGGTIGGPPHFFYIVPFLRWWGASACLFAPQDDWCWGHADSVGRTGAT